MLMLVLVPKLFCTPNDFYLGLHRSRAKWRAMTTLVGGCKYCTVNASVFLRGGHMALTSMQELRFLESEQPLHISPGTFPFS